MAETHAPAAKKAPLKMDGTTRTPRAAKVPAVLNSPAAVCDAVDSTTTKPVKTAVRPAESKPKEPKTKKKNGRNRARAQSRRLRSRMDGTTRAPRAAKAPAAPNSPAAAAADAVDSTYAGRPG